MSNLILSYLVIFIGSLAAYSGVIKWLNTRQFYQAIYDLGPGTHQAKRTPSFGGGVLCIGVLLAATYFKLWMDIKLAWVLCVFGTFCGIGFIDDLTSVLNKNNKGLSAKHKFLMQTLVAGFFMIAYHMKITSLGMDQFVIYTLILVGVSNATNLSDGLDGLLAGLSLIVLVGFWLYFHQLGYILGAQICLIVGVVLTAFLGVNYHPAKQFMGDTGSLGLGAFFGALSIVAGNIWIIAVLGGVFILETLSVIIQVAYFKRTQNRVFLMSPLHHHFELLGLSEQKVVWLFWLFGLGFLGLFCWGYL